MKLIEQNPTISTMIDLFGGEILGVTVTIPAGREVSVCKSDDPARAWKPYVLQREVCGWQVGKTMSGAVVVEEKGWLILTRAAGTKIQKGGSKGQTNGGTGGIE